MENLKAFNLTKSAAQADAYSSSDDDAGDDDRYPSAAAPDEDDASEFRPRKRRRHDKDTARERAALGVFGSDSDDDGPGKGWKKKRLRGKGVSFVSSGFSKGADDGDEEEEKKEEEDEEEEDGGWPQGYEETAHPKDDDNDEDMDDDDADPGAGLGFRAPAAHNPGSPRPVAAAAPKKHAFDKPFVPSSASQPVLRDDATPDAPPPAVARPSAFGSGSAASFAARMMAKMGYKEGQGLGADGKGRSVVVEAVLRPQGVGLGAVREKSEQERREEKKAARARGEEVLDSEEEERREHKRRAERKKQQKLAAMGGSGSGSGSGTATPRRLRTKFVTAEELRATVPGLHIPEAFVPILDLTGSGGGRLLTSASGLLAPGASSSVAHESAELAESRKLIRRARADLLAFAEEWKSLEERRRWIELQLGERRQAVDDQRTRFRGLEAALATAAEELPSAAGWIQTVECLQKTIELDTGGGNDDELADVVVAALHPFLREAEWDPLLEPSRFAAEIRLFSPVLTKSSSSETKALHRPEPAFSRHHDDGLSRAHRSAATPYESMLYTLWLPSVLAAVRTWDPSDTGAVLALFDAWHDVLPDFIRSQVVDAVVRRLEGALSDWHPRRSLHARKRRDGAVGDDFRRLLPHIWLFPWLPHLPAYHLDPRGTGLVAEVRRKFCHLVGAWDFARGAIPGLADWRAVFGEDQWRVLVMGSVLPAMGRALRERFTVDPADQAPSLPVLAGALAWSGEGLLGARIVASVLVQEVFPAWHARLAEWLDMGDAANLEEVAGWFGWWTDEVLPAEVTGVREVAAEFDRASRRLAALVSDEAMQAAVGVGIC